jgi:nitrite reductase (NADH) small subunit
MTDIVGNRVAGREIAIGETDGEPSVVATTGSVAGAGDPTLLPAVGWTRVCRLDELTPGRGAVARVRGDQVAVFRVRTSDAADDVFALGNLDPFSGAQVLSRGIVGDAGGIPKVASPVYKQGFDLRTGACFDDPAVSVPSYPVTVSDDGWVSVGVPAP